MSKLQSILFDADEGPASSLLRQVDASINDNRSTTTNSNSSNNIKSKQVIDNHHHQLHIDASSTTLTSLVGCNISPSSALSPQSVLSDDHSVSLSQQLQLQQQRNSNTVKKLREQIQALQNVVAEERTLRKKKEKSILKLAKELTSRSIAAHRSHQQMEELQETIQDLEQRLLDRNRIIQTTLPQIEIQKEQWHQTLLSYQNEIHTLQQQQQMMISRERSMRKSNQMLQLLQHHHHYHHHPPQLIPPPQLPPFPH